MQQYDPNGGKSWMGSLDSPMAMEYASYIGKRENFSLDQNIPPGSAGEAEWREWWLILPVEIVKADKQWRENISQIQNQSLSEVAKKSLELSVILNPPKYSYSPPNFNALQDRPALQQICRNHWQEYMDYRASLPKPVGPAEPQDNGMWQAVKDYEQELGRTARPFQLYIQFVDWPSDYKRVISDSHLVLGTDYKTSKRGEYQELIREVIGKLV